MTMNMNIHFFNAWVVNRWGLKKIGSLPLERLATAGLGLGGEAGETQEHVKKLIRDKRPLGAEFLREAGDVLHYLTVLLNNAGYTLDDAAAENVRKLEERDRNNVPMQESAPDEGGPR